MEVVRQAHAAVSLSDGKVLVTGGRTADVGRRIVFPEVYDSAELYDPAAGDWSSTGAMSESRSFHTATVLQDGRVLVAGSKGKKTAPETYEPANGVWSEAGQMVKSRADHTATLLQDGRVLIAGGVTFTLAPLETAEVYEPAEGAWSATGSMSVERTKHTGTLLQDGRVLVTGSDVSLKNLATAEIYDPATGAWTETGSMVEGRVTHTATLLPDGRVLVVGGRESGSAEIYDPTTGAWSSAGVTAETRGEHAAVLLKDGRVLIVGGSYDLEIANALGRASAEVYNPASNTWSLAAGMASGRYRFTATLFEDGAVLVAGGQNVADAYESAEVYTP